MLYVGRFVSIKGLDRLIDAVGYMHDRPSLRLILVGGDGVESPAYRELKDRIEDRGLQDVVIFAGRIDQRTLPLYYSAADVLILPSHHESFGLVAIESLACGTPVVAAPVGAMPTVVRDGVNGLIVRDADPRPLARGVESILSRTGSDPTSPGSIRATVADMSWQHASAALLDVYREAMGR